ncbi:glycoside hydrolase family 44 protein [Porcipelethomonas sp.]|uniref:glycoside hydrolase family 44 protein n=1 Tax=Porcipelethomonas sp. TaxID=2981675 RepID=UPI003EF68CC2
MHLHRKFAGLIAGIMSIACIVQPVSVIAEDSAESYSMNVSVNLSGEKKKISPYIYGINQYGNTNNYKNVTVHAARQGGNRYTGYNWETNWSNAGEDWINSSDTNIGDISNGPGYAARKLSEECEQYNIPYKITTLQMAGYVAADKLGEVTTAAPSDRWLSVDFRKNAELLLEPDLTDNTVYMDEYVNYLVENLGDSTTSTGIQGYSLDNEPFLWNDTHPYNHPEECTADELIEKSVELAKVVKEIDPNAEVYGPALWGMLPCIQAGTSTDFTDAKWESIKGNYNWYLDYYLESMANAEKESGQRLLDVVDVHYYAQDCSTDDGKLQAARSLYDESYVENSWLQPYYGKYFPLLPNIQKSIDQYYPGTKIAISEYNLADISNEKTTGKNVISAIAESEALGAFAENNVYFATYWGTLPECPYVESAINLYTNYDGKGSDFGNTLVETKTDDLSKSAAFAAIDDNDDSTVGVVLSNKNKTASENAVITIDGSSSDYKSAVVYAVEQDHSDIRIINVQNDLNGNEIEVTLPPLSVAHVVISDKETDAKVYEAPDITVKETVYNVSDLSLSEDGAYLIPLGDKEHLKEFIFSVNSYSTEGSSYYSGGGGLCFSELSPVDGGENFWGFKSVNFSNGQSEISVPFDDEYTNASKEVVKAEVLDENAQWQPDWWKFSEKEGSTGSDVVVNYSTVKLVYEYDNSQSADKIKGDVNNDGKIDVSDIVALSKWLRKIDTEIDLELSDLNSDGKYNIIDLIELKRILINQK